MSRLNRYGCELRDRLRDPSRWPNFPDSKFLDRLDKVANRALTKGTIEGYLAAVLIYHQLVEELFRLILSDAQFHIQLALFPQEITIVDRPKQMFGQLQQQLSETVNFWRKDRLIQKATEINKLRIEIVHKLTRRESLAGIAKQAKRVKRLYEAVYTDFDEAHDNFRLIFHDFNKDLSF